MDLLARMDLALIHAGRAPLSVGCSCGHVDRLVHVGDMEVMELKLVSGSLRVINFQEGRLCHGPVVTAHRVPVQIFLAAQPREARGLQPRRRRWSFWW